jgi:hypothetical protein
MVPRKCQEFHTCHRRVKNGIDSIACPTPTRSFFVILSVIGSSLVAMSSTNDAQRQLQRQQWAHDYAPAEVAESLGMLTGCYNNSFTVVGVLALCSGAFSGKRKLLCCETWRLTKKDEKPQCRWRRIKGPVGTSRAAEVTAVRLVQPQLL